MNKYQNDLSKYSIVLTSDAGARIVQPLVLGRRQPCSSSSVVIVRQSLEQTRELRTVIQEHANLRYSYICDSS